MVRNNRQLTRLFFALVIAIGLFGGWYTQRSVEIEPGSLESLSLTEESNWLDIFAAIGEEAIQLFLGFTSSE